MKLICHIGFSLIEPLRVFCRLEILYGTLDGTEGGLSLVSGDPKGPL